MCHNHTYCGVFCGDYLLFIYPVMDNCR